MKQKILNVVGAILIVVAAIGGFYLGQEVSQKKAYEKGYAESWKRAGEEVKKTGMFMEMPEVFFLLGKITEIKKSTVEIKANPVTMNPFEEQGPEKRIITVTEKTKIVSTEEKTPEEMSKEQKEYEKKMKEWEAKQVKITPEAPPEEMMEIPMMPMMPEPFKEVELKIGDLKVGDEISVEAKENIKMKQSFEAATIRVSMRMPEPEAMPGGPEAMPGGPEAMPGGPEAPMP